MGLGSKLRALRLKAGLSQQELSRRAGIAQTTVAAYEIETREPSAIKLAALAKELGTTVEEMIQEDLAKIERETEDHRIHGNSRSVKIQEVFQRLQPAQQRAILQQAEGLLELKPIKRTRRTKTAT